MDKKTLASIILIPSILIGGYFAVKEGIKTIYPQAVKLIVPNEQVERIITNRLEKSVLDENIPENKEGYEYVKSYLSSPFKKSKDINFGGFYIVAFSNMAEGLNKFYEKNPEKREEIEKLVKDLTKRAIDRKITPFQIGTSTTNFREEGFYLGHLNVILGINEKINGETEYSRLNKELTEYLAKKTLEKQRKHLRSFANQKDEYPADQSTILYSLWLYDQIHKTSISKRPIKEWLNFMNEKATDKKTELPISEVTGTKYGNHPRGCALSWTVRYMHSFAPDEADKIWENYKKHFKINLGPLGGFREWPSDFNGPQTIDTGPIIFGVGTSATVLGMSAAKEIGDIPTYFQLKAEEEVIRSSINLINDSRLNRLTNEILARAIEFYYNQ